jgi:hypothetical protein
MYFKGDDDVVECVWDEELSRVIVRNSHNHVDAKSNLLLENVSLASFRSFCAHVIPLQPYYGLSRTVGQLSAGRLSCKFERELTPTAGSGIWDLSDKYHIFLAKGDAGREGEC